MALALLAMLALSRVMVHSGMIDALAAAAARAGLLWPLAAPAVGVLGTFVTGSATASNILFSEFQVSTATALSLSPVAMLAAQGFGAAIGNVIAPHNIIAGSATVGLAAREGDILARTAPACALYALAGGRPPPRRALTTRRRASPAKRRRGFAGRIARAPVRFEVQDRSITFATLAITSAARPGLRSCPR